MLNFYKKKRKKLKYKCPCCGYYTLKELGVYDICPVCYWEDDPFQIEDPDLEEQANTVSLNQAKENYKKFGACEERLKKYVRQPKKDELTGLDYVDGMNYINNFNKTLDFYCQNELEDFIQSELFLTIEQMAKEHRLTVCYAFDKGKDKAKSNNTYLGIQICDENNQIVEIYDDGFLSISTELITIDKKERIKFFPWNDEDFIDSLKWVIGCLENYK